MTAKAIFGDVHGEHNLLLALIEKIRAKYPDAELFSVGDLIDRGPDSKKVIQTCIDENVQAILGNHETYLQLLITNQIFDSFCLSSMMGGKSTIASYGVDLFQSDHQIGLQLYQAIPQAHKDWLKSLSFYRFIESDGKHYCLVHAGVVDSVAQTYLKQNQTDQELMEELVKNQHGLNSILWNSPNLGSAGVVKVSDNLYHFKNSIQIFGHKPVPKPLMKNHFIAMDTGCGTCRPYKLSAIVLPTMEIIEVP